MKLPDEFLNRMQSQLGTKFQAYLDAMEMPPRRALRANTLKVEPSMLPKLLDIPHEPCGSVPEGMYVPEGFQPGHHPLHSAGLFYMQEPSAQVPVALLDPKPGEVILDLCAAPGGKSGQIAARMENTGLLISNEIVPARSQILCHTVERLGVKNALVTCMHPEQLLSQLKIPFDAILVDAPCSGEGMFRRDEGAVEEWSPAHVSACAERQRNILATVAPHVRPGGRLVYSTCTFSKEENEDNVRWFLSEYPSFHLAEERHLYPHEGIGEGQYAALLVREGITASAICALVPATSKPIPAFEDFVKREMTARPDGVARLLKDGRIFLTPSLLPASVERLRVVSCGVEAGELKQSRFEPAHALFLAHEKSAFRSGITLEGKALMEYLAGETLPCDGSLSGYTVVCAAGYPVGFAKASSGQLKNRLPKGLRIR